MIVAGEALVQQVIELVEHDGMVLVARIQNQHAAEPLLIPRSYPSPQLASLHFPSGRALSPGLRRWLAFDQSWLMGLGWFNSQFEFTPRSLGKLAHDEYGEPWGTLFSPLSENFPECFLLPGGSDSRRIYAITEPNQAGEYPVLVLDIDDQPYVGLIYPGLDCYLGCLTGLVSEPPHADTYDWLSRDPYWGPLLQAQSMQFFQGEADIEAGISPIWPWVLPPPEASFP